jgi:hypothetical protein
MSFLSLDLVVKALQLEKNKIQAIYQFGSRVYQSHTKDSDYDIFIIYNDDSVDEIKESFEFNISGHLLNVKKFKESLDSHNAVVTPMLWIDEQFNIFENEELLNIRKSFMIDLKKLERGFLREENVCLLKSKRLYSSDKKKSLKNLVHGIRYLMFALQIAKNGKIDDYTVANSYYHKIISLEFDSWQEYMNEFKEFYEKLHEELKEYVFEEKTKVYEKYNKPSTEKLLVIQFLKENELRNLKRLFSVNIQFLEGGLIHLLSDSKFSNMSCPINQECRTPIILDKV